MDLVEIPKAFIIKTIGSNLTIRQYDLLLKILCAAWYEDKKTIDINLYADATSKELKLTEADLKKLHNFGFIKIEDNKIRVPGPSSYIESTASSRTQARELGEYWNSKKIIVHGKPTLTKWIKKMEKAIRDHGLDEVKKAIDNYMEIIESNQYFYSYRHELDVFLSRIVERFLDVNDPHSNFSNDKNKKNQRQQHHSKDPMYKTFDPNEKKDPFANRKKNK